VLLSAQVLYLVVGAKTPIGSTNPCGDITDGMPFSFDLYHVVPNVDMYLDNSSAPQIDMSNHGWLRGLSLLDTVGYSGGGRETYLFDEEASRFGSFSEDFG
jgi:hypothetical protein